MAPRLQGEGRFTSMPDLEPVSPLPTSRSPQWPSANPDWIPREVEYTVHWVKHELGPLCSLWSGGEHLRAGWHQVSRRS